MKIIGKVEEGNKIGQKLGFPTANVQLLEQINPGIYAGNVFFDSKKYDAALYVGSKRPDILEVHVLDFSGDLYGKFIEVEVLQKIRNDKFFSENDNMVEIIQNDINEVKNYLNSIRNS